MALLTREHLEWRIKCDFGDDADEALRIVDRYGAGKREDGGVLVQLACVVMAEGDMTELCKVVATAKVDYHDVLDALQARHGAHWRGDT